ncbi:MAG: F420-0--gamma-glutamyl ligase [Ruminococcaceae bacterium]|nr:F420-0--gamma-glutamyl ligase [Oscillospiraceae bacterium]
MDFVANEEKKVEIETSTGTYLRHAIQTHFVNVGESYIDLMEKYVKPIYQEGDIVSASEKVIALCQGRIVTEEECKPGFWAKFLCRFVHQTSAGPGMGLPVKMQFAINECGTLKVIWAAICAGFGKLVGKKGVFYDMLGDEVYGLDGFFGRDIPEYEHMGVRIPANPDGVCDEIYEKCGIKMMIVDASDLAIDMLGKCSALKKDWTDEKLLELIRDNPAGQDRQLTPFILIRKKAD